MAGRPDAARISYKEKWQEARAEIEKFQDRILRLRREIDRLSAALLNQREPCGQIVDLAGIARHMKVDRNTPPQWRQRRLLPEVDFPEVDVPLWYASTIKEKFVIPTGRSWYENPVEADDTPDDEGLSPAA